MKEFVDVNEYGLAVYADENLIAIYGIDYVKKMLGLTKKFPVKTDLSGNVVMVNANSHEEAINRYLNRVKD